MGCNNSKRFQIHTFILIQAWCLSSLQQQHCKEVFAWLVRSLQELDGICSCEFLLKTTMYVCLVFPLYNECSFSPSIISLWLQVKAVKDDLPGSSKKRGTKSLYHLVWHYIALLSFCQKPLFTKRETSADKLLALCFGMYLQFSPLFCALVTFLYAGVIKWLHWPIWVAIQSLQILKHNGWLSPGQQGLVCLKI